MKNLYLIKASQISRFGFENTFVNFAEELKYNPTTKKISDTATLILNFNELTKKMEEVVTLTPIYFYNEKDISNGLYINDENIIDVRDLQILDNVDSYYNLKLDKQDLKTLVSAFQRFSTEATMFKGYSFKK